jgi:host cell surface-exposed lipoprotein
MSVTAPPHMPPAQGMTVGTAAAKPPNWLRAHWKAISIATLLFLVGIGIGAGSGGSAKTQTVAGPTVIKTMPVTNLQTRTVTHTVTRSAKAATPAAPTPAPSNGTAAQENARRTAEDYLATAAFSRSGLIGQLKYEGYSVAAATYAVDAIGANWNAQAAKSARDYLDMQGFSRSGLIGQLEYDGFTPAQAAYGVNAVGL